MVIDRRSQPNRSVRGVGGSGVLEMLEGKSFGAPGMVVALSGNRETRQHQEEVCLPVRWTDLFSKVEIWKSIPKEKSRSKLERLLVFGAARFELTTSCS
ncbi:MAG: hypothetical protein WBG34_10520, partial [Flavobacteriales bacterium]